MDRPRASSGPFGDTWGVWLSVLFVLLSIAFARAAERTYGNSPRAVFVSVYDGDTATFDVPSWPKIIGERIGVRVLGVDCPELKSHTPEIKALAVKAKEFTESQLKQAKRVELHDLARDKYFRIVADVVIYDRKRGGRGEHLSKLLLDAGLARPYDGGTKEPWEPESP